MALAAFNGGNIGKFFMERSAVGFTLITVTVVSGVFAEFAPK
jgi:hypothetical protein